MLGTGRAIKLPGDAYHRLAEDLNVEPAALKAIANVESSGSGWHKDGRMKILFERHIFRRKLPASKRPGASAKGLTAQGFSRSNYKDQRTSASRYAKLQAAAGIDEDAAFQSISMGIFQIMGFNHAICGYASAREMFDAFVDSELNQVKGFVRFLRSKKLITAIRNLDFAKVALRYNGSGQLPIYSRRMRDAYKKLKRAGFNEKVFPVGGDDDFDFSSSSFYQPADGTLRMDDRGENVRVMQTALHELGYPVGELDGRFGSITRTALLEFQAVNGLAKTGIYDAATRKAMAADPRRAPAVNRCGETEQALIKRGSKTMRDARFGRWSGIVGTLLGGLGFMSNGLGAFSGLGQSAAKHAGNLPGDGPSLIFGPLMKLLPAILGTGGGTMWLPMLALGLFSWFNSNRIAGHRLTDHQTGMHRGR